MWESTESKYTHPFDIISYKILYPIIAPKFVCLGITPNMVTTMTIFLRVFAAYNITKGDMKNAITLFILTYFTDGLDGYIARKFDMKSDFGHYYDRISDYITGLIMFIATIYLMWNNKNKINVMKIKLYIVLFIFLCYMSNEFVICRAKINKNVTRLDKGKTILCKDGTELLWLKYFGVPTLVCFICFILNDIGNMLK